MIHRTQSFALALVSLLSVFQAVGQAPNGAWVYPSATGNLLYQLDERGQRINDFSQCGYRGGTEPLPNVTALIPQSRWVVVSPGTGDDTALIQAAIDSVEAFTPDAKGWRGVVYLNAGEYQLATTLTINASGVVLKGAGDSSTTGTRLRATDARQYTLISVSGSGSRSTVGGTTRNLVQKLAPAGTRTFEVDGTSGLAVGHTVIVKRPSTANWIADIDMDQLGPGSSGGEADDVPWTAGSKDLTFDRTITRIEGNWITVDVPLPQTFESQYGGGQIWRYTWSGRIQQAGIEDIYGFSDYASPTDEAHGWKFIQISNAQHVWVRNITAQYFGYAAVSVGDGAKWLTVADSQCLDPISQITGGRRYSFDNTGAECTLFVNNYAREGRHDFVFGSVVAGPNAFVHCTADAANSDTGPHQRWAVGGLFDLVTVSGNEINVQNRGNFGTGHGWAGAYMAVWNCKANGFRVRNPPTARNWLVGSIGTISSSSNPVGADPAGTYDRSGPTGAEVHPRSLYYGQLQQRMKWPDSEFREVWLGDVDQHFSTGGTGNAMNCDATWLAQMEALGALPADANFDYLVGNRYTACTLDFSLDPGDTIVAASLTVSLRAIGSAAADNLWLDSTTTPQSFTSLGWTPVSTTAPTVRTMEVSPALLADGRLNVALGTNSAVDFAVLHLQVQNAQPATQTITLNPVADAHVMGGVNVGINYGTEATLITKDDTGTDFDRETFLRWDLSGISGKIVQAKVRLAGITVGQAGNENCATFVSDDTWGETTINFTNKPAAGKLFAQWLPVANQAVEFTVTPQVVDTLLGDDKLSLRILSTDAYGSNGIVNCASRENTTVANRPQLILTVDPADAANKAATGSTLNLASAWTGAFVPVDPDTATWNSTSLAGTMTLGANLNWAGLIVSNPSTPLTFNGTQTLTLGSGGIDMSAATVNLTLNHPVILGENQSWDVGAGRTLTANGQISGAWDLTKTGPGSLILSAANTYTGATDIDQGTVAFTTNNSLDGGLTFGATSGNTNTGTLDLTSANATFGNLRVQTNTAGNNTITIGIGKTLTLTGSNVNNVISVGSSGSAKLQVTGATPGVGTLTVNDATRDIVVATTSPGPATTQTLDLSGLGNFTATVANLYVGNPRSSSGAASTGVANNDTLTLAGGNSITASGTNGIVLGGATSSGGTGGTQKLKLGTANLLNATRFVIGAARASGALEFNTGLTNPTVTIRGAAGGTTRTDIYLGDQAVTLNPGISQSGGGSTTTSGTMNFTGGTVAARIDNLIVGMGGGSSAAKPGGNGSFTMDGASSLLDINTLVIARGVSGSGNGTASTGTFTATNGTLQVNTAMTLANDTAPNSGGSIQNLSATFTVAGGNATIGSISTPVNLILGNHLTAGNPGLVTATVNLTGGTLTVFGDLKEGNLGAGTINSSLALNGATLDMKGGSIGTSGALIDTLTFAAGTLQNVATINGSGGLAKISAGTLVLAGTNTYTGTTTVSDGTLVLSGSLAGPLTVNSGSFAPQRLPTTSNAITVNAGGTYQARINGSTAGTQYDQLAAGGSVTLAGPLDLVAGPGLAAGTSFRILNKTSAGAVSGTFAGKPEGSAFTEDGSTWIISYLGGDGNDVVLTLATPAQSWRFTYLGTIANSGNAADTFDANGDGEVNLLEFATGQNPNAASLISLSAIRTAGALEITYSRSKTALTGGVSFAVEWSGTLAPDSWSTTGVTQSILTDNPTLQTVKATVPAGPAIPACFARLKVTSP